jgi:hypothetical protein
LAGPPYDNHRQRRPANLADLLRNQVPDSDGKTIPADTMFGSYELRDLDHPVLGLLYEGKLVIDKTYGHAAYGCAHCCGYSKGQISPTPFSGPPGIDNMDTFQALSVCNSQWEDFDFATNWKSSNLPVATLASAKLHTVAPGGATGSAKETLPFQANITSGCPNAPIPGNQGVTVESLPSGEITAFDGTLLITQGQFLMTLEPSTSSYDNHSVTESSPVLGTNSCWWSTSGMQQYPQVQGSTWLVDQGGDAGHNQYGLDTVGFESGVVNLIQTQAAAHGVEFPCVISLYQLMNYDGIDPYVTNLLTQTIGSNTVNVCRAGVCSGTISF